MIKKLVKKSDFLTFLEKTRKIAKNRPKIKSAENEKVTHKIEKKIQSEKSEK